MTDNFVHPKTVLGNAKSQTWKYFKFRVAGDDIDRSFAHCVLCLESGHQKRGTINLTNYQKFCHNGLGVVNSWICQSSFLSCLAFFCDTRDISFGTLKIGQNNLEIANLEFESHSFLKNHVLLPIEQAEKNLYERVYQDTNFKICLRLFACKGNILYKEHIVHCSFSSSEEI